MKRIELPGSSRLPVPGAVVQGPAAVDERMEVTILVRRSSRDEFTRLVEGHRHGTAVPYLTREDFAQRFGAAPADLALVRSFVTSHGLVVVEEDAARRTLVCSGSVGQCASAFGVTLNHVSHPGGTYRGRSGPIQLPEDLADVVEAVLGLDNRPQAEPQFRMRRNISNVRWQTVRAAARSYTPPEVATAYAFPEATGAGQCIALIELGGGFRPADLASYFAQLGLATPQVVSVAVDHGKNQPTGDASGPDGEVMLDIEVAGAIAPGARIAVYFAPNTDAGFLDAVTSAIHDTTNRPNVLSISWGGPESTWTAQATSAMDSAFQAAATLGITVCTAAGDNGSSDGVSDGASHVDFPSSSPHALACGGTRLAADPTIQSEVVWNDGAAGGATGGGVSTLFALPAWQEGLQATSSAGAATPLAMRGVPDVAGNADPDSGYAVYIDGSSTVVGGTSAVAPLWAALVARLNQLRGTPLGLPHPLLYSNVAALRDIAEGNNGAFEAAPGWDACTGLGSPNGTALLSALAGASGGTAAGAPGGTARNDPPGAGAGTKP